MRIIAGTARGVKLFSPSGADTRPTADMVRESVFNIISAQIQGSSFLDLFGGTGAVALEALSRGASDAVVVDCSAKCAGVIKRNIEKTGFAGRAEVLVSDAVRAVSILNKQGRNFDIIYMDPPYGKGLAQKTLEAVAISWVLAADGFIMAEHGGDERLADVASGLGFEVYRTKEYGSTVIQFIRKAGI